MKKFFYNYWELLLLICLATAWSLVSIALSSSKDKTNPPTIELTNHDLMVIYQNGYIKGQSNAIYHFKDGKSHQIWLMDSAELSNRFFK